MVYYHDKDKGRENQKGKWDLKGSEDRDQGGRKEGELEIEINPFPLLDVREVEGYCNYYKTQRLLTAALKTNQRVRTDLTVSGLL